MNVKTGIAGAFPVFIRYVENLPAKIPDFDSFCVVDGCGGEHLRFSENPSVSAMTLTAPLSGEPLGGK